MSVGVFINTKKIGKRFREILMAIDEYNSLTELSPS
jgi:hypothetical protein